MESRQAHEIDMNETTRQVRQDAKIARKGNLGVFPWRTCRLGVLGVLFLSAFLRADELNDLLHQHPAAAALLPLYADPKAPLPVDFQPTHLSKKDYLRLMAGNVDFWKQHLNPDGAIIDFYENAEKQYSTPAFAL